jgi:hypothetical protein
MEKKTSVKRQILNTVVVLIFGFVLGAFSKFLDTVPINNLPYVFELLDIPNFLGRFAIWLLIGLCISVYSISPYRASLNAFVFFACMVTSYYLYTNFIAGFFPRHYIMIWAVFTIISPVLAFLCWYSKGDGNVSFILSSFILAVMFNTAFVYGRNYFNARSILEFLTYICAVLVLKRTKFKQTFLMLLLSVAIAFVLNYFLPFQFG